MSIGKDFFLRISLFKKIKPKPLKIAIIFHSPIESTPTPQTPI